MQGIEDKIKNNRDAFNTNEPSPEHLRKFESKLDALHEETRESWIERHGMFLRIAATALIFIALGAFFYTNLFDQFRDKISDRIEAAELPDELQEVMAYYNVITSNKVDQIEDLAVSKDEASRIKEMAMLEIKALDEHRAELEKEYAKNPNNERIMNALLQNQQKRSEILDKIINTLNQVN